MLLALPVHQDVVGQSGALGAATATVGDDGFLGFGFHFSAFLSGVKGREFPAKTKRVSANRNGAV